MLTAVGIAIGVVVGALIGHFWPSETPQDVLDSLSEAIQAVDGRLETLETAEATRSAQTAEALDKFNRLFKRMAEFQSRQDRSGSPIEPEDRGESPLDMRRRLRGN